ESSLPDTMKSVFLIGEYQEHYGELAIEYATSLLEATHYDMDEAFNVWLDLMTQVEDYARSVDVNLDGVQLHLNVYWATDGSIDFISYYPKSTSKNIEMNELNAVLMTFADVYVGKLEYSKKYSHNASVAFPTSIFKTQGAQD